VVDRRALLLGGGAALLATGCGKDRALEPPPAESALLRALAAERALGASMSAADRRALAGRSRRRAGILAATLSELGARPHDAPAPEGSSDRAGARERGQAALAAYVTALPSLTGRDQRELGTDLLVDAAGGVALFETSLGLLPDDPFPGTPKA
jgi:hypothetical protein